MLIIKPYIFRPYPEIIFGFSTRGAVDRNSAYGFNLSYSVGDVRETVEKRRKEFFNALGIDGQNVAFQRQIHSDIVNVADCAGDCGESDALVTDRRDLGLAVVTADCTPVFIYDFKNKVIAAVHSGWRGTSQKILYKTLEVLKIKFNSKAGNIVAYLGPSVSAANYEVGKEVAGRYEKKYVTEQHDRYYLDVSGCNFDMLLESGVPANQIQKSVLCTYEFKSLFHSFRRDGEKSGRALGVISLKS